MSERTEAVIFGDIHGNIAALEAIFEDMDDRDLGNRYCLGDVVGYGTSPNEVVEFARVEYDVERAAAAIENTDGMPGAFADMLREGDS